MICDDADPIAEAFAARKNLFRLNLVGGTAVLLSYVLGALDAPATGSVWGGVPASLQPIYTANMFVAATGYFLFSHHIYRRMDPASTRLFGRFSYAGFNWIYAAILFPSALWLPLTNAMVENPGPVLWALVCLCLYTAALGSILLILALLGASPRNSGRAWAIAGAIAFAGQTVLLDALIWPAYFPY